MARQGQYKQSIAHNQIPSSYTFRELAVAAVGTVAIAVVVVVAVVAAGAAAVAAADDDARSAPYLTENKYLYQLI